MLDKQGRNVEATMHVEGVADCRFYNHTSSTLDTPATKGVVGFAIDGARDKTCYYLVTFGE